MLSVIINFLRYFRDPDVKEALSHIYRVVLRNQKGWREEIRTLRAKFRGDESYKVVAFANFAIQEFKQAGITPKQIDRFRIVFSELLRNAFEHGCKNSRRCRVSVRCIYCRWFIRLQIADSGDGFDLTSALDKWKFAVDFRRDQDRHGLWIVGQLTDSLRVNKAGNTLTAFFLTSSSFTLIPVVQRYKRHEILVLNVDDGSAWDYMAASWRPLAEALENAQQKLVLINCQAMYWDSDRVARVRDTVGDFKMRQGCFYAFLVDRQDSKLFNLKKLESGNLRVFEANDLDRGDHDAQIDHAREWLFQSLKDHTSQAKAPPTKLSS